MPPHRGAPCRAPPTPARMEESTGGESPKPLARPLAPFCGSSHVWSHDASRCGCVTYAHLHWSVWRQRLFRCLDHTSMFWVREAPKDPAHGTRPGQKPGGGREAPDLSPFRSRLVSLAVSSVKRQARRLIALTILIGLLLLHSLGSWSLAGVKHGQDEASFDVQRHYMTDTETTPPEASRHVAAPRTTQVVPALAPAGQGDGEKAEEQWKGEGTSRKVEEQRKDPGNSGDVKESSGAAARATPPAAAPEYTVPAALFSDYRAPGAFPTVDAVAARPPTLSSYSVNTVATESPVAIEGQPSRQDSGKDKAPVQELGTRLQLSGSMYVTLEDPSVVSQGVLRTQGSVPSEDKEVPKIKNATLKDQDPCAGKRVLELDIPPAFNRELMVEAQRWIWHNSGYAWELGLSPVLDEKVHKALNRSWSHLRKLPPWGANSSGDASSESEFGFSIQWPELNQTWFGTSMFGLEIIFHSRMRTYKCRTEDPGLADAVYVPYYLGLDLTQYVQGYKILKHENRTRLAHTLSKWLAENEVFKGLGGKRFFFVSGRVGWDYKKAYGVGLLEEKKLKRAIGVSIETGPGLSRVYASPYPTLFHPGSRAELKSWMRFVTRRERRALFSLAVARRGSGMRDVLFWQCQVSQYCWLVDCDDPETECKGHWPLAMSVYLNSVFCLQPRGDTCTRRGLMDSILTGCIPVVFESCALESQYNWHLPNTSDYFIHIPAASLEGPESTAGQPKVQVTGAGALPQSGQGGALVEAVLRRIPEKRIRAMRRRLIHLIPQVTYGGSIVGDGRIGAPDFEDAFDLTIHGIVSQLQATLPEGSSKA